jgi:uncharacterized protein (TIGR03663 family)
MNTSSKAWLHFCWIAVLATTVFLRFDQLSDRPFHFDEATGARIASQRIHAAKEYSFNPEHNHGPLLSAAAEPICNINGETTWPKMTKLSLRLVPAIAGTLIVLIPLFWRRRFGDVPVLVSAALLATSPLLAYYSRMFIHEMLLTLLGITAVVALFVRPKYSLTLRLGVVGGLVGLMFATKETFAISIIAWMMAGLGVAASNPREVKRMIQPNNRRRLYLDYRNPCIAFAICSTITAGWYYSNGLSNISGIWDGVRTFFIYKTTAGHDKPFVYYIAMMALPTKNAIWWHELPVLVLASVALIRSHLPQKRGLPHQNIIRFLAYSAIFHILIYSLISYKTPWLMCLPWAHVCLLGGLSFQGISHWKFPVKAIAVLLLLGVLFQQYRLSRFATGRFANDNRNPYVYTPTSRDVASLQKWMQELSKALPPSALEPVGVVGSEYWPLPWYLRDFESIGYWPEPAAALSTCPLVLAMPEMADEVSSQLGESHIILPRSLRTNVPVMLYLRKDHWETWIAPDPSETP